MCGICGMINTGGDIRGAKAVIGAMCDVIKHRGPDEAGYFVKDNIALGMRRLKIIDLLTGSQPIFNEDRSIVVVFNGELYNFHELKCNLIKKGHRFYTKSDTEVLVHLYEDYGEEFLQYLNGMFGIALWDKNQKKLILARDRMGEKPVYYTESNGSLVFGSELKSILCFPKLKKEINKRAVNHYFSFNYIPAPLTIYENIYKLFPGEYLTYQNNVIAKKKYWDESYRCSTKVVSEEDLKEQLYDQLCDAVKLRLISDVPLGAFLSGGIDSSIMVALMSKFSSTPVKTFSIGLENEKSSELPFARLVAEQYATEHHELIAKPEALSLVDRLVWHFDEPFGDSSAIPTFLVSELTKNHVTVAISGDGGDELFGGYERYQRIMDRTVVHKAPKMLRQSISKLGNVLPFGFMGKAFLQSLQYDNYYFFTIGTSEQLKYHLLSSDFLNGQEGASSFDVAKKFALEDQPILHQCMFYDQKAYLPDDILTKVDRMSMANSLETRAPFLDHNLVEFAMTLPPDMKLRGNIKKYILKETFKEYLPKKVYTHKKTGFSIPLDAWFRRELRGYITEILSKKRIEETGILSYAFVKKLLSQHMSGQRNHERLIWMILMFQLWFQTWFSQSHPKIEDALRNNHVI